MNEDYLTKTKLLERGWTNGLIDKFLPEPDQTKTNPHYRSAAPMKLYHLERIEAIEQTDKFHAAKDKANGRRQASQKAVSTKIAKTMEYVDRVKIKVRSLTKDKLINLACEHYNMMKMDRGNYDSSADKNSNPEFLKRICVNYLRHCMTRYEAHLDSIVGRVGTDDAYFAIKEKVLDAIAEYYPWLSGECQRQTIR